MAKHQFPHSTSIAHCEHHANGDLDICFASGGTHRFKNVHKDIVEGLKKAESPGAYFHLKIRKNHESHKLD